MKIILAIHHFPPNYNAGAEIYTYRLANRLVQKGHLVEVVCVESITHTGQTPLEFTHHNYEGCSVWRLYFNRDQSSDPFTLNYNNPEIGQWFTNFLVEQQPDLVHINSCYLLSVSIIAAITAQNLPFIVTLHDFWFVCPRIILLKPTGELCTVPENPAECAWCLATEKRRFRWMHQTSSELVNGLANRLLAHSTWANLLGIYPDTTKIAHRRLLLIQALKQANLILSPSQFLRDIFISQGIAKEQIIYSRIGLDTSHWETLPQPDQPANGELRVSYIGQIAPHKGVHLLVKAFNQLDFSKRPAHLKIYGDPKPFPKYTQTLYDLAKGNPHISFAGRFNNGKVAVILQDTDITVAPSIWYENSPIAIMEALTCGTPVVTSNLGGMPELVEHNVNGLLFEPNNAEDLARQLQKLVDDPQLVQSLTEQVRPVRMIDDELESILDMYEKFSKK